MSYRLFVLLISIFVQVFLFKKSYLDSEKVLQLYPALLQYFPANLVGDILIPSDVPRS